MKDWKENLFNQNDYNWTDEEFKEWESDSRKHIKHYMNGRRDHKDSVSSISNTMFAHRMDKLKTLKLHPIEQSRESNKLWKEHLNRIHNI